MNKAIIVPAIAIFLMIVISGSDVAGQAIASKDLPYFIGRIRVVDSWGDTLDYSQFLEWRIDSAASVNSWTQIKSPDRNSCWVISSLGDGNQMELRGDPSTTWKLKFQLMTVLWGIDSFPGQMLTVWEKIGRDSIRFLCIDSIVSRAGINEIKKALYFPDSSILLYCGFYEAYHGSVEVNYCFFRGTPRCDFQCLYAARWSNFYSIRTNVLTNYLVIDQYRVSEVTEYFRDFSKNGLILSGPNSYYDGHRLDSTKIRVIDLWELAKEKFNIDTTIIESSGDSVQKRK